MEVISWGLDGNLGDLEIEGGGKEHMIKDVDSLRTMGVPSQRKLTRWVPWDLGWTMWTRQCGWIWNSARTKELRKEGNTEDTEVVQSCILHSCESWSWNKEMVDALHGWEGRNLDLMSSRRWTQMGLSLEWFRTHQIRWAWPRFIEGGGENIECLVLQRIWNYKKRIFSREYGTTRRVSFAGRKRRTEWWGTFWGMRILSGGNRDLLVQRFWIQRIRTRWEGEELEWCTPTRKIYGQNGVEVQDGGTAQEIGKASWKQLKNYAEERWSGMWTRRREAHSWNKWRVFKAKLRRKDERNMTEREKQRICDPAWKNHKRIQILGDSNLIVNWMNGKWKINNQKFRKMIQRTQNMLEKTDLRPMADHIDMFQHVYREWNQEADRLTHVAREHEVTWNSYAMGEGERVEAVRWFSDGGVRSACNASIKKKVWSVYVIQVAERIEEDMHQMKWRTIIEVANILPNDATLIQDECTAAVGASRAIAAWLEQDVFALTWTGIWSKTTTKNKTRKKAEQIPHRHLVM